MFRLLVLHGHEEKVFAVPEEEAKLGSSPENDFMVCVPGISRRHAIVRRVPGGVEVVDLGSKNGLYVEGRRVEQAILTPGIRIQIGAAWIEIEELSSSEAELSADLACRLTRGERSSLPTIALQPLPTNPAVSSPEAALQLAYHLDLVEANTSEQRQGLIARFRTTLGAEVLVVFKRQRNGTIDLRECDGPRLSTKEEQLILSVSEERYAWSRAEVRLKRTGIFLLAGRGSYFLAARFPTESLAREGWRKDFLRFLASRFLVPAQPLRKIGLAEIRRVLMATGGNKSETARILGVTRQTIHTALKSIDPKR